MKITANLTHFRMLNEQIRTCPEDAIVVDNCIGQRYIASGMQDKRLTIHGTPGNALGAYLNGAVVEVFGNAQDATGDTMNDGEIIIHGDCGDATGYSMRGGKIFVRGNVGYRSGVHMKAYQEKFPVLVVGGAAGSFLGEYQAGGLILVLGRGAHGKPPVRYFCGTGMHGGKIILRCAEAPAGLPPQVQASAASDDDLAEIQPYLAQYCAHFDADLAALTASRYITLRPNPDAAYRQLYTYN